MNWKEEVSDALFAVGCCSMNASFELAGKEAEEAFELGQLLMDAADALSDEYFQEVTKKELSHESA